MYDSGIELHTYIRNDIVPCACMMALLAIMSYVYACTYVYIPFLSYNLLLIHVYIYMCVCVYIHMYIVTVIDCTRGLP